MGFRGKVPSKGTEILRDRFGVAHVSAKSTEDLFYGYGWATTHSHANLLLKLYAQSRGRGAEIYGPGEVALNRWVLVRSRVCSANPQ